MSTSTFSDEEISKISKCTNLSEFTVRNTLKHHLTGQYLSYDTSPAISSAGYTINDSHILKTKQAEDIHHSLKQLNAVDQLIITYYFGLDGNEPMTAKAIARKVSLSVTTVSSHLKKCYAILKKDPLLRSYI